MASDYSESESSARAALGASMRASRIEVDGVTLAYDDDGEGSAIICLHAIGHGARDYEHVRGPLSQNHRVIALDWPDHGQSEADREPPSVARYAELLRGFMGALRIERAVLIGNSIGGGAAIRFAALHPDRVEKLVLANPAGLEPHDALAKSAIRWMTRFFAAGARGASWFPLAFAAYYRLVLPTPAAAEHRARIVRAGRESAATLAAAWASFGEAESDLRALVPQITCPVLFTWAVRDRVVQLRRNKPAIASFSNTKLETFAAGHSPHVENPERFVELVSRFLDS